MYVNDDDPANGHTFAYDINNNGQIIGTLSDNTGIHGFIETAAPDPPPPPGTTADMILRHGADGFYEIYDIGSNAILAGYSLGQVGTDYQIAGLGDFDGSDTDRHDVAQRYHGRVRGLRHQRQQYYGGCEFRNCRIKLAGGWVWRLQP